MGRFRSVLQDWIQTHIVIAKIISCCVLVVSLILIIVGAILVSQNDGHWDQNGESFDSYVSRQSRKAGGVGMIMFGVFLLICSMMFFCCSFQLKFMQRAVEPGNHPPQMQQQQPPYYPNMPQQPPPPYPTNVEQVMPMPEANKPPYPT